MVFFVKKSFTITVRSTVNGDRLERVGSLSRGSAGKGSLGRYSVALSDVSAGAGSNATRHWVNSVSDIYGPDEIEELLEDLNRLELAAFETEEIQDFDIDGSQARATEFFINVVRFSLCIW